MDNYSKGTLFPPNDCGIFEHTIDCGNDWSSKIIVYGRTEEEVTEISTRIIDELNGTEVHQQVPDYAAAFNMWMDTYINDPQSFETSYDTAMRHVSEKLGGNEPSYGEVAAEQFKQYLEQVNLESTGE